MTTVTVTVPASSVQEPASSVPYAIQIPDAIATVQAAGYTVTQGTTPPPPAGSPLLTVIKTLGANEAGVWSGQTLDLYSKTPLDAMDTTPGVSFPSVTVHLPGPATGYCPAIIDLFADPNGPAGNIEPNNPPPNDTVSLANAALAAGCVLNLNGNPPNPAGASNNPWPSVLTTGSAVQNAYLTTLAKDAAMFKKINGPFIYDFLGEMNLPGGLGAGNNWASIGVAGCTSANFAALWVLTWNFFAAQGLNDQILWAYETNDGVGNYTFGYPGDQYVDIVGIHTWAPFTATAAPYAAMVALNKPLIFGSCGLTYQSVANFSGNNYTQVAQVIASKYPLAFGIILWNMGGNAYSQQNGAAQALSTAPWLNRKNVPTISGNK